MERKTGFPVYEWYPSDIYYTIENVQDINFINFLRKVVWRNFYESILC